MAKAAWLTVAPMSGTGNATITNTGTVHTGREQRTTTCLLYTSDAADD